MYVDALHSARCSHCQHDLLPLLSSITPAMYEVVLPQPLCVSGLIKRLICTCIGWHNRSQDAISCSEGVGCHVCPGVLAQPALCCQGVWCLMVLCGHLKSQQLQWAPGDELEVCSDRFLTGVLLVHVRASVSMWWHQMPTIMLQPCMYKCVYVCVWAGEEGECG
jgi:hypothetical protein